MRSLSKTIVSLDAAQAIVAATFGSHAAIRGFEELTDGFFNAAYAITLADGLRCVLKVAPPDGVRVLRYEGDILAAEVAVLRLLRVRTSIPVPEIFYYDTARRVLDSNFYLMAFIEGVPSTSCAATLSPEAGLIDRETGGYLRQMNAITGPAFGYFAHPEPAGRSWRATFLAMVAGVLADGQALAVPLPLPYDAVAQRVARAAAVLDDITDRGWCTGIYGTATSSWIRRRSASPASLTSSAACGAIR